MKEFEKWYYHVESDGTLWPSFGRYDTEAELIAAKEAWEAALDMVKGKIDYANATNDMIDWIFEEELEKHNA